MTKPCIASRSVYRANAAAGDTADDVEAYYHINVFFPTNDNVISDIQLRFGLSQQQAVQLSRAIPDFIRHDSGYASRMKDA